MAAITRSLSPSQQALFAQEKLRLIYKETCISLSPYKDILNLLQDIILWRKMAISAVIYCLMEIFFWHLYTNNNTYITVISDIVFWVILADGFWVVATRDRRGWGPVSDKGKDPAKRSFILKMRRQQKELQYISLEEAIMRDAKSLEIGESAPYEVMCLWMAKVIMLVDNIQLALRHWSQEQPYLFSVVTGSFGLFCLLIGYFISGVFFMFLLTNYCMLLPVFRYYNLMDRMTVFFDSHYPVLAHKIVAGYQRVKSLLSPLGEQEFVGIHLDPNQPMKDDLPEMTATQPDQLDGPESQDRKEGTRPNIHIEDTPLSGSGDGVTSLDTLDVDPGDSLFIPPSEGFPSITAFFNEDSISLPSFPESYTQQRMGQRGGVSNRRADPRMKLHQQRGGGGASHKVVSGPLETLSLDPFGSIDPINDSFDEEFTSLKPPTSRDPPPPYSEPSPYFSPLVSGWNAPPKSSSTPYQDSEEEDPTSSNVLRQREALRLQEKK